MKVVVVGTNQTDRERVAKVIKDRYEGLAEDNAVLLKKLERSNDAWIREREEVEKQIADKKVLFGEKDEQIAALREVGEKLRDYLTESGGNERYSSVDIPDEIWIPFIEALRGKEVRR